MDLGSDTEERRVGRYELLALIGEGGMGVVHLAQGPDGRRVALKVLRPHIVGDQEARDRLAREVTALSRVTSPRVAEILDADPFGPMPYVVTRYVPGLPLHQHVREQGPFEEADLRSFAAGLAEALAAVHRVGVLHRDIKPGNVLVDGRSPVLIDFGLALMAEDPRLTATGWLLGTPGYLAPEVLHGDDPTTASDVHAWAATLVFAATGRPPAGKGQPMAIMDRVRRGEFDLDGVPASMLPMLTAALSADPASRPTVDQLLGELGAQLPPAPAPEPTIAIERTRALDPADPADPAVPELPRRGRHRLGLFGLAAASIGLIAWAPYAGAAILAAGVTLLRFFSVTSERHTTRRILRGRPRWYDVPASTLSSPGYLVFSLVGTALLLSSSAAMVAIMVFLLRVLGVPMTTGLAVIAVAYVVSLWCGPASGRVREWTRRLTRPMSRPTRTGPMTFVLGLALLGLFAALLLVDGPLWWPAAAEPWASGWLARLAATLH